MARAPQVAKEHYGLSYDSTERFCSYWIQIREVMEISAFPILEVGIGNRLVHDYLSRMNIPVTSADIDPDLKPDVVADITHLPFPAKVFGTVIACEVLEHIPFPDAKRALVELARIADYAVISVPDCNRSGSLTVQLPRFGKWSLRVTSPRFLSRRDVLGKDQHYWELGTIDMPVRRLTQALNEAGWGILKHFRPIENAYHHFFILRHQG